MKKIRGFTLIELMVVIAIVAIVTMIATPSLKSFLVSSEIRSAVSDWTLALQIARSEAVRQRARVSVCVSSNGSTCVLTNLDTYHRGWIVVMTDSTKTNAMDKVLHVFPPVSRLTMTANKAGTVTFLPNGLPTGNFAGLRITVMENAATRDASLTRYICVARTGRSRVFNETDWLALPSGQCG